MLLPIVAPAPKMAALPSFLPNFLPAASECQWNLRLLLAGNSLPSVFEGT